ncbi:MAG: DUF547 domain-containing protein [Nitrospiraceae bacterium]|nr:MAG: DUF547 domain-containing protein [Nitrospiraceae bacterium]
MSVQFCSRRHDSRVFPCDLTIVGVLLALYLAGCSAVPKSFSPPEPISPRDFSHRTFDELLRAHVRDGRVNYREIQSDERLTTYLRQLDRVDPNALPTREDRLAFWINAYNVFAIKGILDRLSPATLWGRYRYFIARDYRVGGRTINLYDLERKLLIPDFREPRVHFAIVCASASCPKLQSWAYVGERLNEQLDRAAAEFINDPTRNRFDRRRRVASLSRIFKWFREDFEAAAGSLPAYVARYVTDADLANDLTAAPYTIEFLDYDWSLNGPDPVAEERLAGIP